MPVYDIKFTHDFINVVLPAPFFPSIPMIPVLGKSMDMFLKFVLLIFDLKIFA